MIRPTDRTGSSDGDDRGQLLLVGALALAVLFVALALLLNTAIYTGNLAARDAGGDATPAIEYVSATRGAGADAIRSVNRRNDTNATELNRALTATTTRWDDLAAHHRAVEGVLADTDVAGTTNGTRIRQDDASRNFTNDTGVADWTVADDVSNVRSLRLTVDESMLTDNPSDVVADEVFHVNISSGGVTRSVFVYNTTSGPEVRIVDDGSGETCPAGSVTDGTFVIDVPNESVGDKACSDLGAVGESNGNAAVVYRDGGAAGGTYTMVVDEPPSALSPSGSANVSGLNDGSGSPYWTYAIYSANLTVTYRTADLDYNATAEVVPE